MPGERDEKCIGECREALHNIKMCGLNQFGAKRNVAHPNRWQVNGKVQKVIYEHRLRP